MSVGQEDQGQRAESILRLGADIIAAYVSRNSVSPETVPSLIRTVHAALSTLTQAPPAAIETRPKPATTISKSIQHEYIVCLEDGKRLKMLKRYIRSRFDLTPDAYRRRWGLPADYPMVAPAYAARRSAFAKQIGLGRGVRKSAG